MRKFLYQFAYGRYGIDQLSIFLVFSYFFLRSISLVYDLVFLILLAVAVLVWAYFRIFSRNITARQQENQKYLKYTAPYWDKFNFFVLSIRDKNHRYFRCPYCHLRLRAPRNKGKIQVTCTKCQKIFYEKT